jgi:glycosyltransferase involved in cell wall biosynthesis
MRILWVKYGKLLPVDTGGKIRSYNILRHLASRHHLTLFSIYGGQPDSAYENELRRHFAHARFSRNSAPADGDGMFAHALHYFLRLGSAVPYAVSKFNSPEARRALKDWLNGREFDVAVCDFLAVSDNFPKSLNTPTVLFQHNVEASLWDRQARCERNLLKKAIFTLEALKMKRHEADAIEGFHHVIAVSETDKQLMSRNASDNISVVPTGVDIQAFGAAGVSNVDKNLVVFTGSMDWEANIDAMRYFCAEIWPRVLSQVPDAKFCIVGRNPGPSVKRLASKSVEVTGTVPSVVEYLKASAVVVVPLRIGGGTRLKIFEAMAMEKAVVSTAIGAEGLEVHDGVDILLADSPSDFANRMVRLLGDAALRDSIGKAARVTASKYDWAVIATRFENVLADVARMTGKKSRTLQLTRVDRVFGQPEQQVHQ